MINFIGVEHAAGLGERRWPYWTGRLAAGWAALYAGFGLVMAMTGVPVFNRGPHPGPAVLDWAVVVVAAAAMVIAMAATMQWGARLPDRLVYGMLRGICLPLTAGAFGLLMNLITLILAQEVDSPAGAASNVLAAIGIVLFLRTAQAYRHFTRAVCTRCVNVHDASFVAVRPEPSVAPPRVRRLAYVGAAAFIPYAVMKTTWALGGTFAGRSGAQMVEVFKHNGESGLLLTLESWGLDFTALLASLGVFLLFGLVRPWGQVFPRWTLFLRGRRVPRWLPLTPALIGAATLAPYGVMGVVYCTLATTGVLTVSAGDFPSSGDAILVAWCGLGPFAVFGTALAVAAHSYLQRTRPTCRSAT